MLQEETICAQCKFLWPYYICSLSLWHCDLTDSDPPGLTPPGQSVASQLLALQLWLTLSNPLDKPLIIKTGLTLVSTLQEDSFDKGKLQFQAEHSLHKVCTNNSYNITIK